MIGLPVLGRELRVATRRFRTYWRRVEVAGLCLLLMPVLASEGSILNWSLLYLMYTSFLLLAVVVGRAIWSCADRISHERREQTLGLLFLTDLKTIDVVLGKLAAGIIETVQGVIASIPILALPILFGGVSLDSVLLVGVILLTVLFLSSAVSLAVSSYSIRSTRAVSLSFALTVFILTCPYLFMLILNVLSQGAVSYDQQLILTISSWSPLTAYFYVLSPSAASGISTGTILLKGVLVCLVGGAVSLLIATRGIKRDWVADEAATRSLFKRRLKRSKQVLRSPERLLRFRRHMLDRNPISFLICRRPYSWLKPTVQGLTVLLFVGLIAQAFEYPDLVNYADLLPLLSWVFHITIKLVAIRVALLPWTDQKDAAALESVLLTPLHARTWLKGQLLGTFSQVLPFLLLGVLCIDLPLIYYSFDDWLDSHAELLGLILVHFIALPLDLAAIALLALSLGPSARSYPRASSAIIFRIMILPWAVFLLISIGSPVMSVAGFIKLTNAFVFIAYALNRIRHMIYDPSLIQQRSVLTSLLKFPSLS